MKGLYANSESNLTLENYLKSYKLIDRQNCATSESMQQPQPFGLQFVGQSDASDSSRRTSRDYLISDQNMTVNSNPFTEVHPFDASQSMPSLERVQVLPLPEQSSLWHRFQTKLKLLPWFVWIYLIVVVSATLVVLWNYKPVLAWLHSISTALIDLNLV